MTNPLQLDELGPRLQERLRDRHDGVVIIRADKEVLHGRVVEVMDIAKSCGGGAPGHCHGTESAREQRRSAVIRERTYTNLLIGLVLSVLIHGYIVMWGPPFSTPTPLRHSRTRRSASRLTDRQPARSRRRRTGPRRAVRLRLQASRRHPRCREAMPEQSLPAQLGLDRCRSFRGRSPGWTQTAQARPERQQSRPPAGTQQDRPASAQPRPVTRDTGGGAGEFGTGADRGRSASPGTASSPAARADSSSARSSGALSQRSQSGQSANQSSQRGKQSLPAGHAAKPQGGGRRR